MRKKAEAGHLCNFVATWTRSKVYHFAAPHFEAACCKALDDRQHYSEHTTEKLTVRELHLRPLPRKSTT